MKKISLLFFILLSLSLIAQVNQPPPTSSVDRLKGIEKRKSLAENSLVKNIPFKSVGPSIFGGRIADVAVNPKDPSHFYVAYASGGLWKTESNGTSFTPLFDNEAVITVGAVAVDWKKNVIWVGTGEVNSSRSSYAGVGMYRSGDGGKTWTHHGLEETHHIGRIVLDPKNPDRVWVAALGHLYSPNEERGIFMTENGGKTWTKSLYVNENSGAIDLIIDPDNADKLYASTWERTRRAWNFEEGGLGSAIFKSIDGGKNWAKISGGKTGFPNTAGTGRIGLTMSKKDGKTVLFSVLDNYDRRPEKKEKKKEDKLTKTQLRTMSATTFIDLNDNLISDYLKSYNFPENHTAKSVKTMVKKGEISPLTLVEYLESANSLLFDNEVISTEVYRSDDEGETWKKTHEGYLDNIFYSYGYYFGQIRALPQNSDKLYIMGVPILTSDDGGKNWRSINGKNVHVDHHALWLNPNRLGHIINGNDGGINISYDDGKSWVKCNTPAVGQFYYVAVDNETPYNIYGGLQDNGVWMGKSTYKASDAWHNSGQYPYKSIMGGDGMQVQIDSRDNTTVYTGYQFGNYYRINTKTESRKYITPKHKLGERPFRWNWQSPILISKHNQDIIYFGSNKLHRSFNQGDDWDEISGDLTTGGRKGDVAYSTITTIDESSLKFGLIYVGTDDGNIQITKDGGNNWEKINDNLPEKMWVTRIISSNFEEGRVYAALNGYRWDDFSPMLYKSENYGETWTKIGTDLPSEPINVVKEDPVNEKLIYVGTDNGLYISLDEGENFMLMNGGLPAVAVHDVVVHPREKDLIVGTHGRSIYLGDVSHLQQLKDSIISKSLYVFDLENIKYIENWGSSWSKWLEPTVPEIYLPVYSNSVGKLKITIKTNNNIILQSFESELDKGLNYPITDLSFDESVKDVYQNFLNENKKEDTKKIELDAAKNEKYYLQKGEYLIVFEKNGERVEKKMLIE